HRSDYGRSQSFKAGQASGDDLPINKSCHSGADTTILPSNRVETATKSLSEHIQSQPECLQQCIAAQRVPDPCRSGEKLHEFLPDCEKVPGPSQQLQATQWIAYIYGKKNVMLLTAEWKKNNPPPPKQIPKKAPVGSNGISNVKKQRKAQNKGKGKAPGRATESQKFIRIPWRMYFIWPEQC
ncbi:hypothetical protein O181_131473, partial [Austropuccinia psidii MF-1]|nr:hypothetical protein [Austropuccinia psidii MF-1]